MTTTTNNDKEHTMMMNTTLEQLRGLKLNGMAGALQDQLTQAGMTAMSFEERMALLVDREVHWRNDKRQTRLLKQAHLKYPQAAIEDIDARAGRGLDRRAVMSLALGDWIDSEHSVLITGPTGAGKSWLGCALAQYACRRGHSAMEEFFANVLEDIAWPRETSVSFEVLVCGSGLAFALPAAATPDGQRAVGVRSDGHRCGLSHRGHRAARPGPCQLRERV